MIRSIARVVLALSCSMTVVATVAPTAIASAQAATAKTASQAYTDYLAALKKAKTVEEIFPLISAKTRSMVEQSPKGERAQMFELLKMMTLEGHTGVKVVKETATATGATLSVEGLNEDKSKAMGTIEMVKEGGAWKVGQESWK